MERRRASGLVCLLSASVISGGGCRRACEPLRVTAEGQPVQTFRGVAARIPANRDGGGYVVAVVNHRELDCRSFFDSFRKKRDDELMVRVYFTGKARGNVAVNFSNDMGRKLEVVREPARVGDTVEICIHEPSVHEGAMAYQRRRVVVQGVMSAEFCGEAPP